MAKLRINGDSSGYVDLSAPNAASSSTLDLDQVPQKNVANTFTANMSFGDNNKVNIGTGNDLQLYHDGSNNYIKSTAAGWLNVPLSGNGLSVADGDFSNIFFKIDALGRVTKPKQPGFSYLGSKSHDIETTGTQVMSSANVWSASVNHAFNRGSHFNASTGRFTAPVAGTYHFQFQCMAASFSSGYLWFYMDINGTTKSYMQMPQQAELNAITHHMYCELAIGDYVHCSWTNNYNSGFIHYPGFSGYLVG